MTVTQYYIFTYTNLHLHTLFYTLFEFDTYVTESMVWLYNVEFVYILAHIISIFENCVL